MFTWLEPDGHLPEHFHPTLDERWEVLEGSGPREARRRLARADPGGRSPSASRRASRTSCAAPATARPTCAPRSRRRDGSQEFLTESARAAREGLYNARSLPTSLHGAAWLSEFALRFRDETVMCSPPPALQRAILPVAARLTRRYR